MASVVGACRSRKRSRCSARRTQLDWWGEGTKQAVTDRGCICWRDLIFPTLLAELGANYFGQALCRVGSAGHRASVMRTTPARQETCVSDGINKQAPFHSPASDIWGSVHLREQGLFFFAWWDPTKGTALGPHERKHGRTTGDLGVRASEDERIISRSEAAERGRTDDLTLLSRPRCGVICRDWRAHCCARTLGGFMWYLALVAAGGLLFVWPPTTTIIRSCLLAFFATSTTILLMSSAVATEDPEHKRTEEWNTARNIVLPPY